MQQACFAAILFVTFGVSFGHCCWTGTRSSHLFLGTLRVFGGRWTRDQYDRDVTTSEGLESCGGCRRKTVLPCFEGAGDVFALVGDRIGICRKTFGRVPAPSKRGPETRWRRVQIEDITGPATRGSANGGDQRRGWAMCGCF